MFNVIIYILIGVIIFALAYKIIERISAKRHKNTKKRILLYDKLAKLMIESRAKGIIKDNKYTNPFAMLILIIFFFVIFFLILNAFIKVTSTAVILSLPLSLIPIFFINILLNNQKNKIIKQLPMYAINLKNMLSDENNIIKAIQITDAEEPLNRYIKLFKGDISKGVNVIEAFEKLKKAVNIKAFDMLINACQTCYLNGGNFVNVLEQYIDIVSKENINKESMKEKAYSDILTLIIMTGLNIFVIFGYVFSNMEYANIIRNTLLGRVILDINALSYILIAYFVTKIYKEE